MKRVLALILIFAMAAMTFACAGDGTTSSPQNDAGTPPSENGDITPDDSDSPNNPDNGSVNAEISGELTFWMGAESLAMAIIEGFNTLHPNVVVVYEEVSLDAADRLTLDGPAGFGPDVIAIANSEIRNLINDGFVEPFPTELQDKVESMIHENLVSSVSYGGRVYGVPYSVEPIVFFYNKDMVDGPPETMEEIIELSVTYNDPSIGKYLMRWPGDGYHNYLFLSAFGWQVFGPSGEDWKNPGFDTPEVARGLEFYASMRSVFDFSYADINDWGATVGAFERGETPFTMTGPWGVSTFKDAGLNFGTSKIPTIGGVQPHTLANSQVVAVSSYSENFDAAFAFAEYIASNEVANMVYNVYGAIPALIDTSGIEGLAEDEWFRGMVEQARYTHTVPTIPEIMYLWAPWAEMFAFVWDGLMTIEEAQQKAMEDYEHALNLGGLSMFD